MATKEHDKYDFKARIDLEVDSSKYLFFFRVKDLLFTLPWALLGVIYMMIIYKGFNVEFTEKSYLYIIGVLPAVICYFVLSIQSSLYERRNISYFNELTYKYKFKKRKKTFQYSNDKIKSKGEFMEDIRSQIGIFDISKESYELLDDVLVKVIQVSCINVTGLPRNEQRKVYKSFEEFNNKLDTRLFPIQIATKTKPISLENYIEESREVFNNSNNKYDRLFGESYIDLANDIQKNKKMVSKSPYIIIKRKKQARENTEEVLEQLAEKLVADIENMLPNQYKLHAKILNNEELFKLLHYSIDYVTANVVESTKLNDNEGITFSKEENDEFYKYWKEKEASQII